MRKPAKAFTKEELDYIQQNYMDKSIKEMAIHLGRSYNTLWPHVNALRIKVPPPPKYKSVKLKHINIAEPPKPPRQRPPAQYSNKPTGIYYQP